MWSEMSSGIRPVKGVELFNTAAPQGAAVAR
jgi:hypothetical protein